MMKSIFATAAVFAALTVAPAFAEDNVVLPMDQRVTNSTNQGGADVTRTQTQLNGVCLYDGRAYSVGAHVCTTRHTLQICVQDQPGPDEGPRWDAMMGNMDECPG